MIGEADLHGVFVSWALIWPLAALAIGAVLRRLFAAAGFYRLVWHPALFDLAMFVILWWGLSTLAGRFGAGPVG